MNTILSIIRTIGPIISQFNLYTPAGEHLYETARKCLGKDMGDSGYGNVVDCAVTVNNIVFNAFGDYAGGDISTYRMYHAIKNHAKFVQVFKPRRGDIILSPSGLGNGTISNGHVGIMGDGGTIMSNSSGTGLFEENYTLATWTHYYNVRGGFPITYWRRITK